MSVVTFSKSQRTRAALRAAALDHFVRHGFEAASVPAIAAEVGVTERTFYRHFATKDEVLFDDVGEAFAWFARALHERPADEDLVRSVLVSLGSGPTDPQLLTEIARLRAELLGPERIGRVFRDRQAAVAREVRGLLVGRGADELTATVHGEVVAGAVFAALAVWTEAPPPHDLARLGELTRDALEKVRPVLSPSGTAARTPRTARGSRPR
jgi:AcrR family transcriptional regulator